MDVPGASDTLHFFASHGVTFRATGRPLDQSKICTVMHRATLALRLTKSTSAYVVPGWRRRIPVVKTVRARLMNLRGRGRRPKEGTGLQHRHILQAVAADGLPSAATAWRAGFPFVPPRFAVRLRAEAFFRGLRDPVGLAIVIGYPCFLSSLNLPEMVASSNRCRDRRS
ncbi:hypothetical protein [Paenibacillus sp. UNC496MF]|uniref:hypothetical protein n=1 Tax=Paenibacillus sp. UNC496MF TaxID=1502753 RepID=UPI00210EB17B|nr:hypothetical protein [Paenibacillus sp. UNC496MF]